MKVIVVGAGYVGGALADTLHRAGHSVWALRRKWPTEISGVHCVAGNVSSGAGCDALPRDADALVYAVSPGERSERAYLAAYPEGVGNILSNVPTKRLLLVSSTSVYGESREGWVDEETPTEPQHFSGQCVRRAEQVAFHKAPSAAIVRASGIYGPGRTGLLERVRQGHAVTPDSEVFTNRIHRDDLVGVLRFLVERRELTGTFLATDTEPVELSRLHAWLAARLGVPVPPRARGGEEPRVRYRVSKRCVPRRLLALNYPFRYPTFREGYSALLAELH